MYSLLARVPLLYRPSATMYSTLARSLSEAIGSWKIIWILRVISRSNARGMLPLMRWPR